MRNTILAAGLAALAFTGGALAQIQSVSPAPTQDKAP